MAEVELELREWLESLDYVLEHRPPEQVQNLLRYLQIHAEKAGVALPFSANTPYTNTIQRERQPSYPGNRELERRIKSLVRWNAMAMVVRANRDPAEFDDPENVDISRRPNRHLAFAMGHHICLGATLARLEGKIAIGRLVERFPNIRRNGPAEHLGLARFRGFNHLPVAI